MVHHNDAAKEWGALSDQELNPSYISYKPKINRWTVQGESNGIGARIAMGGKEWQGT